MEPGSGLVPCRPGLGSPSQEPWQAVLSPVYRQAGGGSEVLSVARENNRNGKDLSSGCRAGAPGVVRCSGPGWLVALAHCHVDR